MARLPITQSNLKKLFAYSGNQCAMPHCKEQLVDQSGTMLGKVAHICAAEPGGPRYDLTMSDEDRRAFSNLFIVCGKHHDIIDDKKNEAAWPADQLRQFKRAHEHRFKNAETQLIERYVDHTQTHQPVYPKNLKALAVAFSTDVIENNKDELADIRIFIDHLKNCPHNERSLATSIARRMKLLDVDELPVHDITGALKLEDEQLKKAIDILDYHGLAYWTEGFGHNEILFKFYGKRTTGGNPWIEVLDFCEITGNLVSDFIEELNFGLYDG